MDRQPEVEGQLAEDVGVDHCRPDLGQHAVGELGVAAERVLGHDQAEDGVPQKLEPFVGCARQVLGAPRPVGHGLLE